MMNYVDNNVNLLIKKFENKVDIFLSSYIFNIQKLYTNLNLFLQNKIHNNDNIKYILEEYKNIFENLLKSDSNSGLLDKLLKKIHQKILKFV